MYYVCTRSNWQGDNWKPVDSAKTKKEALEKRSQYAHNPHKETGGIDITNQIHAAVFSRTKLTQMGYPRGRVGDEAIENSIHYAWEQNQREQEALERFERENPFECASCGWRGKGTGRDGALVEGDRCPDCGSYL